MKTNIQFLLVTLALASGVHAQGSLTPPPGAPAPVMKSLDQIEARTPLVAGQPGVTVANGLYTITQPGSYYLTGNLTCPNISGAKLITLAANNVTLDLNGFTLSGTTGNLDYAIYGTGLGYRVYNGHIVGGTTQTNGTFTSAGFLGGIRLFSGNTSIGTDTIISNITVRGTRDRGIMASFISVVENCVVDTAGAEGIIAGVVRNCRSVNTWDDAIIATSVSGSVGKCVGPGNGIALYSSEDSTVENSTRTAVGGSGIQATVAINCRGTSISGIGLVVSSAMNCIGASTSGVGLSAATATNCTGIRPGGTAIQANIANSCYAQAGTIVATNKYNMP